MNSGQEEYPNTEAVNLIKIPFWKENASLWFKQLETVLSESRTASDVPKYNYVVMHLDQTTLAVVADIIEDPPQNNRYDVIKERIIYINKTVMVRVSVP